MKKEVAFVTSCRDYLIYLEGLPSARVNDTIISQKGGRALVTLVDREITEALMLDEERPTPGEYFELLAMGIALPPADQLLGRTISPLGVPLDKKVTLPQGSKSIDLDIVAPGIAFREVIARQFFTGFTVVDTLLPIGVGQRELIVGDARSGKTTFLLDLVINQKGKNIICVYTAIGRPEVEVKRLAESVAAAGSSDYTLIVAATSNESAPIISIAPSVACSLAEDLRDQGNNVLLILDDLGQHAKYLREIALISGRIPGRESYPADIFYQHSRLIERAGNFNKKRGGGSITLLPVIETDLENFTSLIPTNLMAMTDGHILFSAGSRSQGHYPAILPGRSVTRVGPQTQSTLARAIADRLKLLLADYEELERYGRFSSEISPTTQKTIKKASMANELLRQDPGQYIDPAIQILILTLVFTPFFDHHNLEFLRTFKNTIIKTVSTHPSFTQTIQKIPNIEFDSLVSTLTRQIPILEEACRQ